MSRLNDDLIRSLQALFGGGPIPANPFDQCQYSTCDCGGPYPFTPPPYMRGNPFGQAAQNDDIPPGTIDLTFEEIEDESDSR